MQCRRHFICLDAFICIEGSIIIYTMKDERVQLFIKGRVQGVFFRASTRDKAMELGVTGWVKNSPDGSVEAVFEGPKDQLKKAVNWCHKGPTGARVTGVDEKWYDYTGDFDSFDILFGY
jgi:acylphosphatase